MVNSAFVGASSLARGFVSPLGLAALDMSTAVLCVGSKDPLDPVALDVCSDNDHAAPDALGKGADPLYWKAEFSE